MKIVYNGIKRKNAIKRHKMKLFKLFFKTLNADKGYTTVIGCFRKAYFYFVDIIRPGFRISFGEFSLAVVELGLYPAYDEEILKNHLEAYREFERNADKAGIIMLDPSCKFILLLESYIFDFNMESWWDFPKEKKEPFVSFADCAKQEALEETGREVTINKNDFLVETIPGNRRMMLFFVYDWPLDSEFLPQTSNEIKSSAWFRISYLNETPPSMLEERIHPGAVQRIKLFIDQIQLKSNQRISANLAQPDTRPQSEVAFVNKKDFPF